MQLLRLKLTVDGEFTFVFDDQQIDYNGDIIPGVPTAILGFTDSESMPID